MLARIRSATLLGLDAINVDVEIEVRSGKSKFTIIGLGDSALKEARDRVISALKHSGFKLPREILINLAPADVRKEGAAFDLAMALGILIASDQVPGQALGSTAFYGELSLDGRIKPVRGVTALSIAALQNGLTRIVVPHANAREAKLIQGLEVIGIKTLTQAVAVLRGEAFSAEGEVIPNISKAEFSAGDISDVWGQELAKRGLVIAAAGGHNVLMIGPPGCGKSMLAQRFGSLLPNLNQTEMLEVVKIQSIGGSPVESFLAGFRPYRNPHHVISEAGLVGGGSSPRPGEISMAHHGVLFLDEFPEFSRPVIEALRAPLESGKVSVARAKGSVTFPAEFQLIAAMNPCPCGRLGQSQNGCLCSQGAIQNYLRKLSKPILDRIDIHVDLDPVPVATLASGTAKDRAHESEGIRAKIQEVRERQLKRRGKLNSRLSNDELRKAMKITGAALTLLEKAADRTKLSARGFVRTLRLALSISDLKDGERIEQDHVAEALSYRSLDRLEQYCRING